MFRDIIDVDIEINEKITIDSFVSDIEDLGSLDVVLDSLDDESLQFYSDNEKQIDKLLKRRNLSENWNSPEDSGYAGWSPSDKRKVKTIKYKGDIISLEWDPELATWQPSVRFRSVTKALKYGKILAGLV